MSTAVRCSLFGRVYRVSETQLLIVMCIWLKFEQGKRESESEKERETETEAEADYEGLKSLFEIWKPF